MPFTTHGFISSDEFKLPDTIDDAAWDTYFAAQEAEKAAIVEADLQASARDLVKEIAEHWALGVYATVCLGELLEEKRRRLDPQETDFSVYEKLAAWLRDCVNSDDEHALPSPDDCSKLINKIAHCCDDGVGRPKFFDIGD